MDILLVNEHQLLLNLLHIALERKPGVRIAGEFLKGEDALAALEKGCPDLVILGMQLPDMDGVTLTEQILRRAGAVRILAVTDQKEERYLLPFLLAGGRGYMSRYLSDEEFYRAVEEVMAGKIYLSAAGNSFLDSVCQQLQELLALVSGKPAGKEGKKPGALPCRELSDRERQILHLYVNGYSSSEIGSILYMSVNTVETYKKRVKEKLQMNRKADLTQYAREHGLLEDWD